MSKSGVYTGRLLVRPKGKHVTIVDEKRVYLPRPKPRNISASR